MILNNMGQLVDVCWRELPKHFQYLKLDEYVVMPNHVHGFVHIDHVGGESEGHGDLAASVETRLIASLPRRTSTANSRVK
jgi:REP element-mobilizing transposase RayT